MKCNSHQGCGQTEDGEEGTSGGEGGVLADSCLFPHLYISSGDVISQRLWDHGLLLLTHSNVTPRGNYIALQSSTYSTCMSNII